MYYVYDQTKLGNMILSLALKSMTSGHQIVQTQAYIFHILNC